MNHSLGFCVLSALLSCSTVVSFAAQPVETFSEGHLDYGKWYQRQDAGTERVLEVKNGKLQCKTGGEINNLEFNTSDGLNNYLELANPSTINSISVDVTLNEVNLLGSANMAAAEILADLYRDEDGTVTAYHGISSSGTDYLISYGIYYNSGENTGTSFSIPISAGTEYTLKVEYDGDKTITFHVGNQTRQVIGPDKSGTLSNQSKQIGTIILGGTEEGEGYVSATFDNIVINDSAYDDFSAALNGTKWWSDERVREMRNSKLHLNIQNNGFAEKTNEIRLHQDDSTNYFQAEITLSSDTILNGDDTSGEVGVFGALYNDTLNISNEDGFTGEVIAGSRLLYTSDGNIAPQAIIYRCDDNHCNSFSTEWENSFSTESSCNLTLDEPANLAIERLDDRLIFHCNKDKITLKIPGDFFPSNTDHRKLRSSVYSAPGQNGYLKATFDNVYNIKNFPWSTYLPAIFKADTVK